MTPQQLVGLACRLFAVWLVLNSIAFFTAIPAALASAPLGAGESAGVSYAIGAAEAPPGSPSHNRPAIASEQVSGSGLAGRMESPGHIAGW